MKGKDLNKDTRKFLSWNVNGIRAIEKKGFVDTVKDLNPDIIGIQEIKAQKNQLSDELINIDNYYSYWNSAERKGYSGVCVYTKEEPINIILGFESQEHDIEGRCITLEYDTFYFINLYFPNAQDKLKRIDYKLSFNNKFLDFVNNLKNDKTVIICGDFNVAHKPIDLKNPKANENNAGFSKLERIWMDKFISSGYIDTFRKFNNQGGNYSWWSYRFKARAKNIGWRIDYFCINKEDEERVKDAIILKDIIGSDHCPVGILFN